MLVSVLGLWTLSGRVARSPDNPVPSLVSTPASISCASFSRMPSQKDEPDIINLESGLPPSQKVTRDFQLGFLSMAVSWRPREDTEGGKGSRKQNYRRSDTCSRRGPISGRREGGNSFLTLPTRR